MTIDAPPEPLEHDELEALIEEAWQRTRRRRRRIRAALAVLLVILVAVGVAIARDRGGDKGLSPARSTAGTSARTRSVTGRYWYTRTIITAADGAVVGLPIGGRETVETWIGVDGSWRLRTSGSTPPSQSLDMVAGGDNLFPPQANATASFDGALTNVRDPGDGLFTYGQLRSLPTNPAQLAARIQNAVSAQTQRNLDAYVLPGPRHGQQVARLRRRFFSHGQTEAALIAISDLYASPIPQQLRAGLYRATAHLRGVRTMSGSDGLGRPGVALSGDGGRLIFNPRTGALLSGVAGTLVAQGQVDAIDAVPQTVRPITTTAVAQPPQLTVAPAAGSTKSSFRVSFHAPRGAGASQPAPGLLAYMFGPTGPGCIFWVSRPPIARIPVGSVSVRNGIVSYTYTVSPSVIARSSWCPGRYQLMITPIPPNQALNPTQLTRSHAAAYLHVR